MKSQSSLYVIPLSSKLCRDSICGSKAARLADLIGAGFHVPHGFVVSADAFAYYCDFNKISLDQDHLDEMVERIMKGNMPEELETAIFEQAGQTPNQQWAVRSSAIGEDGADFSMAGQLHTFLFIKNEALILNIKKCWAGLFNHAVSAYKKTVSTSHYEYRMGVLVQHQIDAEYAGVLFTFDPHNRHSKHLIIEWVDGVGEKLVSGTVTPHRIYLKREHPQLPSAIPDLIDKSLMALHQNSLAIEAMFRHPVDIEWAIDAGGLHILQARPITTLFSKRSVLWSNVNMVENFPAPLTPLTWSFVSSFYTSYCKSLMRFFGWRDVDFVEVKQTLENLTGIHYGRIYYNLSSWYKIFDCFPISSILKRYLDNYIGQNIPFTPSARGREEQVAYGRLWMSYVSFFYDLVRAYFSVAKKLSRFESFFYAKRQSWRSLPYAKRELRDLMVLVDEILQLIDRDWIPPALADLKVMIFPSLLKEMTKRWVREPQTAIIKLLGGIEVSSTAPSRMIMRIAQNIKRSPSLKQLLDQGDYQSLEAAIDKESHDLFATFMEKFGGRCYQEALLISPTFEENHSLFWDLVKSYQMVDISQNHAEDIAKKKQRSTFTKDLFSQLSLLRRISFRWVLKETENALDLRERGRLLQSLLFGEMRQILVAIGAQFYDRGLIPLAEDIFYLELHEIRDLIYGKFHSPKAVASMIELRKKELIACAQHEPDECFVLDYGELLNIEKSEVPTLSGKDDKRLRGQGVSGGRKKAKARIILDPANDHQLSPGEILVTRTTDPGWTPLFVVAGGLILEKGGMLSHGAIVAREFGLPAVVGVEHATKFIKDGSLIIVDGTTGEIELVEE